MTSPPYPPYPAAANSSSLLFADGGGDVYDASWKVLSFAPYRLP